MTALNETRALAPIFFACGGTAGHINPALALAKELRARQPQRPILFLGTTRGLEQRMVQQAGFEFQAIEALPFHFKNPIALFKALRAYKSGEKHCLELIRDLRPAACVGTGGYVCAPLMGAAKKSAIPRLIHEQNVFAGRSNRMMSQDADCVCISWEASRDCFRKAKRVVLTGNPVSKDLLQKTRETARAQLGLSLKEDERLLVALGGSLGARNINRALLDYLIERQQSPEKHPSLRVILATGPKRYDETCAWIEAAKTSPEDLNLTLYDYLDNMTDYMAAADLLICRSGAMTCAEVAMLGRAAIFVPYPYAAADHQTANAKVFVEKGAAELISDDKLEAKILGSTIEKCLSSEKKREAMEQASRQLAYAEAVDLLCDELEALIQNPPKGEENA